MNGDGPRQTKKQRFCQNDKISRLLMAVQKRVSVNKKEKVSEFSASKFGAQVEDLPYELIFKILLLLPADSLYRSSFVCKEWFSLINSSNFVEEHTRQSETVFIFLKKVSQTRPQTSTKSFSIEAKLGLSENKSIFSASEPPRSYLNFVDVQDGKGKVIESNTSGFKEILATCDGLVLATCEQNGGLFVFNPMTRKVSALPLGTILPYEQSYGFIFSPSTGEYKVVHLFLDETRYVGCEVLSLNTRSWRGVDGPSIGLFRSMKHNPVAAVGALHWLPARAECDCLVSMGIDDEKFRTRSLPIRSSMNDRLVDIGGFLSFVTHVALHRIEVWMLKGLEGEGWVKRHIITSYRITDLIPISTLMCGRELIFKGSREPCFYSYDIENQVMRKVEMEGADVLQHRVCYLPHVNTLVSGGSLPALR